MRNGWFRSQTQHRHRSLSASSSLSLRQHGRPPNRHHLPTMPFCDRCCRPCTVDKCLFPTSSWVTVLILILRIRCRSSIQPLRSFSETSFLAFLCSLVKLADCRLITPSTPNWHFSTSFSIAPQPPQGVGARGGICSGNCTQSIAMAADILQETRAIHSGGFLAL